MQNTGGVSPAVLAVGAVELVFGVHAVVVQDVGVALHPSEERVRRCIPVGGDRVAGPVGVVPVAPVQFGPAFSIVVVGGDEQEPGRVDPGRVAEGVEGGDEQEVERFDLVGPEAFCVPPSEGS